MAYLVSFLIGQGLEVIAMFESGCQRPGGGLRTEWIPQFKDALVDRVAR
jgi:hypothetical protein